MLWGIRSSVVAVSLGLFGGSHLLNLFYSFALVVNKLFSFIDLPKGIINKLWGLEGCDDWYLVKIITFFWTTSIFLLKASFYRGLKTFESNSSSTILEDEIV